MEKEAALHVSVSQLHFSEVSRLLSLGASIHWIHPVEKTSPLDVALTLLNSKMVRLLLSKPLQGEEQVLDSIVRSIEYPYPWTSGYEPVYPSDAVERVEVALEAFRKGQFLVVEDAVHRENEGDLIIAAEFMTKEKCAFMIRETTGMLCCSVSPERYQFMVSCVLVIRVAELELPPMVEPKLNTESHGTAFTVSVDIKHGTSTGISASDRALTIAALANPNMKAADFNRPGHMFPLKSKPGGVIERPGHTEAGFDLCKLAGLYPAAALCEICNRYVQVRLSISYISDGSMTRPGQLDAFAKKFGLCLVSIADIIEYRKIKNL